MLLLNDYYHKKQEGVRAKQKDTSDKIARLGFTVE
jgi:hypothetical protein